MKYPKCKEPGSMSDSRYVGVVGNAPPKVEIEVPLEGG